MASFAQDPGMTMHADFDLSPQDWTALRRLLEAALTLPPLQRSGWLDALGEDDARFAPRLRALLAHADRSTVDRLLTLPRVETGDFAPSGGSLPPPETAGPYRLLRLLGEGGMASVWLAERTDMLQGRRVALKLPHGAWRRAGLGERLAREREILATLNHPNIARLYDAGVSADGQPWLALEHVEGERIDAYCERKGLDVPRRLRLFLQVARAVAHAHANLVVHRDLKPSNILVTEGGDVRLLDFGIAKLLDPEGSAVETALTQQSGRALTPEYAAPEQILGRPVGTGVDVYALGVVLFELLCGQRPYRLERRSRAAIEEAVLQAEPPRPSAVTTDARRRRLLRGDLDTIVAKALKKDPAQRYATVDALAEDIERHLEQRPVLARPDSRWYRLRRFLHRHRFSVAAGTAISAALLAGTVVALWQAHEARIEQRRAEAVKDFIAAVFQDANPFQQGSGRPMTAVELLRLGQQRIERIDVRDALLRVELLQLLGDSLVSLEDVKSADKVLRQALAEAAASGQATHAAALNARRGLVQVLWMQDRPDDARAELEGLLPELRRRAGADPAALVAGLREKVTLDVLDPRQARLDEAAASAREALELIRTRLGDRSPDKVTLLTMLYTIHRLRGEFDASLRPAHEAYAAAQALFGAGHPSLNDARLYYSQALSHAGRHREAAHEARAVLAETEQLFGASSRQFGLRMSATFASFVNAGFVDEAIRNTERGLQALAGHAPPGSRIQAAAKENRALAQLAAWRCDAAATDLQQAVQGFKQAYGPTHETVAMTTRDHAIALACAGRVDEAEARLREAAALPPVAKDSFDVSAWTTGIVRRFGGRHEEAWRLQQKALASLPERPANALQRALIMIEAGQNLVELDRYDEAEVLLRPALRTLADLQAQPSPALADAQLALARTLLARGLAAQALPLLQQADALWRTLDPDGRRAGEVAHWLGRAHAGLGQAVAARTAQRRAASLLARSPFARERGMAAAKAG